MNTHPKNKNSPNNPKEERNSIQKQSKQEKQKHKCPACHELSHLMCYGCCFQFTCQNCYSTQHYSKCNKKFNHYAINLNDLANDEETKTKRNGRKRKTLEKCQRCLENGDNHEFCIRCKVMLCSKCISQTHSTGKFSQHTRIKNINSPSKLKKMETFVTQTDQIEDNAMKKSTKQNIQHLEHVGKAKERSQKLYSTPSQKKGRSVAKAPNQNQQNMTISSSIRPKQSYKFNDQPSLAHAVNSLQQNQWQSCHKHHKIRSILTQNFDLICQECYEQTKSQTSKLKNVDTVSWISTYNNESIKLTFQTSLNEFTLKMKQLETDFSKFKGHLLEEFTRKQDLLAQRYKYNLSSLEKWQHMYKQNILNIIKVCQDSLDHKKSHLSQNIQSTKQKMHKDIQDIFKFQNLLALQQITQYKRQFYLQQQQYQFKINEINPQSFEDLLKTFSFVRRKLDNQNQMNSSYQQKSLSKINQSNPLRQSRFSNSSLKTDRKTIIRDESFQKSNYYDLSNSNNLAKRSISKEIKEDLGKDISQKILFQNNSALKSQKRSIYSNNIKKVQGKPTKNGQYFFDSVQESSQKIKVKSRKQPIQLTNYCFKEVKYVDLQNFLTQKLDKIYDEKKEMMQSSKIDESKSNLFKNDMEISTQLIDLRPQQIKNNPITDSRMTYSITIDSSNHTNQTRMSSDVGTNSINNSIHTNTNKNKRKSDYMEMRDRLRKPNVIHKIGK